LLIAPNPESALNDEAGKLLLENYDLYAERAKLYTKIHALPSSKDVENISPMNENQSETVDEKKNAEPTTNETSPSRKRVLKTSSPKPEVSSKLKKTIRRL
jgi:ubiquitin-conjugating enzyme E2 S